MTIKQVSVRSVCSFPERGNSCMVTTRTSHFRNACKNLPPYIGPAAVQHCYSSSEPGLSWATQSQDQPSHGYPSEAVTPQQAKHFCGCALCILFSLPLPRVHRQSVEHGGNPDHNLVLGGRAAGQGEGDGNSRRGIVDSTARGARQET